MANRIQIRRGTDANRLLLDGTTDIRVGELLFTTDDRTVFIGDGSTNGGYDFIGAQISATTITVSQIGGGTENAVITFDSGGDAVEVTGSANEVLTLNGSGVPTFAGITSSNVNAGDFITDLSTDPGANKFVDAQTVRNYILAQSTSGIAWRPPADLLDDTNTSKPATTATTVDGQTVVDGDRVLFTNLSGGEVDDNNSVFLASVDSAGDITWTQEIDGQDSAGEPTDGDTIYIQRGDTHADRTYNYNGTAWVLIASLNGALLAVNNLSDVSNTTTARTNLGAISADSTDTLENKTLVSTGAGGNNPVTVDYTDLSDETAGDILYWDGSAGPSTLPIGTEDQVLSVSALGVPEWTSLGDLGGDGDVSGPASSTDNEIVRYDGTSGKVIQNGTVAVLGDNATVGGDTMAPVTGLHIDAGDLS